MRVSSSRVISLLLVAGLVTACGDAASSSSSVDDSESPTAVSTTETTEVTSTPPAVTTTSSTVQTTTTGGPSAATALAEYFTAVEEADEAISAVSRAFDAGFDEAEGTLTAEAKQAISGLDLVGLGRLIPAGLTLELETAALTVFSDLVSRWAALDGAGRYLRPEPDPDEDYSRVNVELALTCLGYGHTAKARFDDDLAKAMRLARSEAPPPLLAPDSEEHGVLAVRLEYIRAANFCCDSCGGLIYAEAFPVDWESREGFDAEFVDGQWLIQLHAG